MMLYVHGSPIQLRNLQDRYLCWYTHKSVQFIKEAGEDGQGGFYPPCKLSRRDFFLVGKFTEGILSTL